MELEHTTSSGGDLGFNPNNAIAFRANDDFGNAVPQTEILHHTLSKEYFPSKGQHYLVAGRTHAKCDILHELF